MRLIVCGLSAVLMSGCSWLGYDNSSYYGGNSRSANTQSQHQSQHQSQYQGQYGGQYAGQTARRAVGPCQITSPTQAIPQGCRPEQVTFAIGNGGQYGQQAQYATGGYGSHAGNAQTAQYQQPTQKLKRPSLRGSIGLEFDHSVSGTLFETSTAIGPTAYNRAAFAESSTSGVVIGGDRVRTVYTSDPERIGAPAISFDDVYYAPLRVSGGLEYIFSDHVTTFANAGYTRAEGKKGGSVGIIDSLRKTVTTDTFDAGGLLINSITNSTSIPNQTVAQFDYDFNDLERIDLELGGRYYFDPVFRNKLSRTLTPFVSASGGAAYYSETTVTENQRQLFLQRSFDSNAATNDFYDVSFGAPTQIYDAQWVPYGALKAGLEWQMTPKTALAFEAGVKYEKQRDFSNGAQGDENITIPVAIRGSYNF